VNNVNAVPFVFSSTDEGGTWVRMPDLDTDIFGPSDSLGAIWVAQ
jgi:hypothetical protein